MPDVQDTSLEPDASALPVPATEDLPASELASVGSEAPTDGGPTTEGFERATRMPARKWVVPLAVVIVAIIVVLALVWSGVLFSHVGSTATGGGTEAIPFSTAYSAVNSTVQNQIGGPWSLVSATAIIVPPSSSFQLPSAPGSPCDPNGTPSLPSAPATDAARGIAPDWLFSFESSDQTFLGATDFGGTIALFGPDPATDHCDGGGPIGILAPPSTILDSSQAVAILGANLTAFIAEFPSAVTYLSLTDEGGAIGRISHVAIWTVESSPCVNATFGSSTSGYGDPGYIGGVNGTSSQLLASAELLGLGYCSTPGVLGADLQLGDPVSEPAAYNVSVTVSSGSLTLASFQPAVYTQDFRESQANVSAALDGFEVFSPTGTILGTYNFTTTSWTSGGAEPLSTGDTLSLLASTAPVTQGAVLVLVGSAPTTGEIGVSLP
jgi:hypothetical protein